MTRKFWMVAFVAIAVLLVYNVATVWGKSEQDVPEEKLKLIEGATYNVLNQGHFMQLAYDDEYSRKVFDEYFKNLDFEKKYFTQDDFKIFDRNEDLMDDDFKDTNLDFFNLVDSVYEQRLSLTQQWYKEILDQPFDYNTNAQVATNADKIPYVKNLDALKDRWEKILKHRTLAKYVELKKNNDEHADSLKKVD